MSELLKYSAALIKNDTEKCAEIEKEHDLYGYPPETVSVGLEAIDNGFDGITAIMQFTAMP